MFKNYPTVTFWKVELIVTTIIKDRSVNGSNKLILKTNQVPYNGSCQVYPLEGIALDTNFTVNCNSWVDDDGYIYSYQFIGKIKLKNLLNF